MTEFMFPNPFHAIRACYKYDYYNLKLNYIMNAMDCQFFNHKYKARLFNNIQNLNDVIHLISQMTLERVFMN
jgi:hypothetical protein